jgi:Kef-type K+ transport system membrane component KefB
VGGLVIVFLFFWLCVKVGIKPTVGVFTAGLWPRKRRRRQQRAHREETADEHSDETPPQA